MLCLVGVSSKEYIESSSRAVHRGLELSCPDPDCADARLVGHGGYRRYLGGELQKIARVCCRRCGVTHGVLPGDACAYRDMTLDSVESAWDAQGPRAAVRASSHAGVSAIRSMRRVLSKQQTALAAVRRFLPTLPAHGLAGLRAVLGSGAGVLLRVRELLWSTYRLWFSGLCGLWRHGRPPHLDRRQSTNLGSCSSG